MINKKLLQSFSIVFVLLLLAGCAPDISTNKYNTAQVGAIMDTYEGVIVSRRKVEVQNKDNHKGALTGAALGGTAGGLIGANSGSALGGLAIGGIAGALAGSAIAKNNSKQQGWEYTIRLTNGSLKTVIQGLDVNMQRGQHVLLHVANTGRSRIVPISDG